MSNLFLNQIPAQHSYPNSRARSAAASVRLGPGKARLEGRVQASLSLSAPSVEYQGRVDGIRLARNGILVAAERGLEGPQWWGN
jgi:hypothetical protein